MLKLDFKDFFPSIRGNDFFQYFQKNSSLSLSEDDLHRLVKLLFWLPKRNNDFQLSIGAPSSPFLSNAIMYKFDEELFGYCSERQIIYTRYADDITFSMHEMKMRGEVLKKVKDMLISQDSPVLKLNTKKNKFWFKS